MDVDEATLNLVNTGIIDATIAQKPYTMAFYGLKQLDDLHHYPLKSLSDAYSVDSFSPVPTFVDTGTTRSSTRSNVDIYLKARLRTRTPNKKLGSLPGMGQTPLSVCTEDPVDRCFLPAL